MKCQNGFTLIELYGGHFHYCRAHCAIAAGSGPRPITGQCHRLKYGDA